MNPLARLANRPSPKAVLGTACIAAALRMIVAINVPISVRWPWYSDDELMLSYSQLSQHFHSHTGYELLKTMSYPVFLAFVTWSGMPYRLVMFGLWLVAALSVTAMAKALRVTNPIALLGIFVFVLYFPTAFDFTVGTDLYRQAVVAPSVFIVLSGLIHLAAITHARRRSRARVLLAGWTGLWLLFVYYIAEAPVWILPAVVLGVGYVVITAVYEHRREWRRAVALAMIGLTPVLILIAGTEAYKAINDHYFGVFEVNVRTAGPFATVMDVAYTVDDRSQWESRTWVPATTWEQLWRASPTLASKPGLLQTLLTSPWANGDWRTNPPPADIAAWAFHDALRSQGLWASEPQAAAFLSQVAQELTSAQAKGTLPKSDKIFLVAGAPGRDWSEIMGLRHLVFRGTVDSLFGNNWHASHQYCPDTPCQTLVSTVTNEATLTNASIDTAIPDLKQPVTPANSRAGRDHAWDQVANAIIDVYRWILYPMVVLAAAGLLVMVARFRHWRPRGGVAANLMLLIAAGTLIVTGLGVIFGTSWFASWIDDSTFGTPAVDYYAVAATPCFMLAEILGLIALAAHSRRLPARGDTRS